MANYTVCTIYIYILYTLYTTVCTRQLMYCIINTPYALSVKKHFRPNKSRKTIPLT